MRSKKIFFENFVYEYCICIIPPLFFLRHLLLSPLRFTASSFLTVTHFCDYRNTSYWVHLMVLMCVFLGLARPLITALERLRQVDFCSLRHDRDTLSKQTNKTNKKLRPERGVISRTKCNSLLIHSSVSSLWPQDHMHPRMVLNAAHHICRWESYCTARNNVVCRVGWVLVLTDVTLGSIYIGRGPGH